MNKFSFWGASDDLLEVAINGKVVDELGCYDHAITVTVSDEPDGGGVVVVYQHSGKHGWQATVQLPDGHEDGQPMLPVSMSLSDSGYSPRVDIEPLHDTARVTIEYRGKTIATVEAGEFVAFDHAEGR